MNAAYNIWAFGSEGERRAFAIEQDIRFQTAMRVELIEMAKDRGLKLAPKIAVSAPPPPKPDRPRDMISIAHTVPSEVPLTDAQRIMKEVCAKHRITRAELIGRQRSAPIAAARHEAAYRMKKETILSLPQIGRRLGGRDHTTALNSIRRYQEMMANGEV